MNTAPNSLILQELVCNSVFESYHVMRGKQDHQFIIGHHLGSGNETP